MHTSLWVVHQKVEAGNGEVSITLREPVAADTPHPGMLHGKRISVQLSANDAVPMEPGKTVELTLSVVAAP